MGKGRLTVKKRLKRVYHFLEEAGQLSHVAEIKHAVAIRDEKILELQRHIENHFREVVPKENWVVNEVVALTGNHRLTIDPKDGRVTLKIAEGASTTVRSELRQVAQRAIEKVDCKVTVRGRIKFNTAGRRYECGLQSESKKFQYSIWLEESEIK